MSNRPIPRHQRALLDRTSPRPEDHAHAWLLVHGERHRPAVTRAEERAAREAIRPGFHLIEDLLPTVPQAAVPAGGAA